MSISNILIILSLSIIPSLIILGLILIQIFCTIAYYTKSKFHLKKFIFSITYKYLNYLRETKPKNQIKPNEKTILVHRPSTSSNAKIDNPPRKIRKSQSGINVFNQLY